MKVILIAVLVSFLSPLAFAGDEIYMPDTIVYMNLGQAPYRGQVSGRLELKNAGPNELTDIRHDIQGPGFSARDNCPKVLAVGKSCKIKVTYSAMLPGYVSAAMWVKTSDKNYDVRISASSADDPFRGIPRNPPTPPRFPRP
ncbi:hypothetical protein D3C87_1182960 [compost metagenome]